MSHPAIPPPSAEGNSEIPSPEQRRSPPPSSEHARRFGAFYQKGAPSSEKKKTSASSSQESPYHIASSTKQASGKVKDTSSKKEEKMPLSPSYERRDVSFKEKREGTGFSKSSQDPHIDVSGYKQPNKGVEETSGKKGEKIPFPSHAERKEKETLGKSDHPFSREASTFAGPRPATSREDTSFAPQDPSLPLPEEEDWLSTFKPLQEEASSLSPKHVKQMIDQLKELPPEEAREMTRELKALLGKEEASSVQEMTHLSLKEIESLMKKTGAAVERGLNPHEIAETSYQLESHEGESFKATEEESPAENKPHPSSRMDEAGVTAVQGTVPPAAPAVSTEPTTPPPSSLPPAPIREIIDQMVREIRVLEVGGKTAVTQVTIESPPLFAGATLALTTPQQEEGKQLIISFANLQDEAKSLLDANRQDLINRLEQLGYEAEGIVLRTTTISESIHAALPEQREREQGDQEGQQRQRRQQQEGEEGEGTAHS